MHKRAFVCTAILIIVLAAIPILKKNQGEVALKAAIVNLTIDVIPGADVGSGSRENWLRERAEEFEKEHPNVFINVRSLKQDQAALIYTNDLREQMGNLAAYTCGALQSDAMFLSFETGEKARNYMYAGYVLLVNPAQCQKQGDVWQIPNIAASASDFDCSGIPAVQEDFSNLTICERKEMISLFNTQEVSAIVASNYLAYRFCRSAANGDGFPVEILPLENGFTDQMHYVSVVDQSEAQNQAAMAFASYLLSKEAQSTCGDIGMFAVLEDVQTYEQGTILCTLWNNQPAFSQHPDPFIWNTQRGLAISLLQDASMGNGAAANDLLQLCQSLAIERRIR